MDQTSNAQGMILGTTANDKSQSPDNKSKLDNIKSTVADKLQSAAGAIKQRAEGQSAVSGYADKASTLLNDAASYVRDVDPQQIKTDIQDEVKRNPGRTLLIAGGVGLLLGILLRR